MPDETIPGSTEPVDAIARLASALADRYVIEREIGAGGMATVYLARDVKHNRRVAVKVLKPELGFVLGAERFLAEIQVTANLQHPNLLPLFDSGEAGGLLYYVMPYVDGETLRHRIEREKQLPIEDALAIAVAVASALEYAHTRGIIHRDLKPENILLQGGQPVVADFGIALAVSNAGGQRVTQSGMSLGTPQYMSPEQATGDRVLDARADIYSLGAVVYEMLAGEPPHAAPTAQAIIAKLLTEEARSIATLRHAVSEQVDGAVLRALEKLPADRFTSARSFADALQGKAHTTRSRRVAERPSRRNVWLVAGSSAAVLVAAFVLWRSMRSSDASARSARYPLAFRGDARYVAGGGVRLALSADGSQLAYIAGGAVERLYLKGLDDLEPRPIPGTEGATNPQFSPDGQWIAFLVRARLAKLRLPGGIPVTIADSVDRFSWGDNDVVVFARNPVIVPRQVGLFRVSAAGGPIEPLATPDSAQQEVNYSWPFVLPGAKAALFNIAPASASLQGWELAAIRLDGSRRIVRFRIPGLNPRYVSTGHIVYSLPNGTLMAAPFDAKRLQILGSSVPVLENVRLRGQGASQFSISQNGTLVYVVETPPTQLVMSDRAGHLRVLVPDTLRVFGGPRVSPDGRHIASTRGIGGGNNIFIHTVATGETTQLTTDNRSMGPSWSADSRRVAWSVSGGIRGARWQPWDAREPAVELLDSARDVQFSPTGQFLTAGSMTQRFMMMLDGSRRRVPLPEGDQGPGVVQLHTISPDGKWIAYTSRGSGPGTLEVYVRPIPGPGGRHQISDNGGTEPRWGATSGEMVYRHRGSLWSATITTSPEFAVVRRDSLFAMNVPTNQNLAGLAMYDVSRDGKNFVMPWFTGEENPPPVLVTGWFADLRDKLATAARAR